MSHQTIFQMAAIIVIICCPVAEAYTGGKGEANDPYQIHDANDWQQLMAASSDWGKSFVLIADVNLAGITVTPVGNSITLFTGILDGDGHIIHNATIDIPDNDNVGLFGRVGIAGQIRNLGVESAHVTGNAATGVLAGSCFKSIVRNCHTTGWVGGDPGQSYFGGLIGNVQFGIISDCISSVTVDCNLVSIGAAGGLIGGLWNGTVISSHATGNVNADLSSSGTGGLAGFCNGGSIVNCYATGTVRGYSYTGGLVGVNLYGGNISSCYATGTVTGYMGVGGLVGQNGIDSSVANCYAQGPVTGENFVGGLVGYGYHNGTVRNSYSAGRVEGELNVGGLIGYSLNTTTASLWDVDTSGRTTSSGGTGKTTGEMKTLATFVWQMWDFTNETAYGTADTWRMCVDGVDYPRLTWEYVQAGDFACPDGTSFDDLARLTQDWLLTYSAPLYGADATGDNLVNFLDFALFSAVWAQ